MSEAPAGIEVGSVGFSGPDASGHFGPYGGVFVGETLIAAVEELAMVYQTFRVTRISGQSTMMSYGITSEGRLRFTLLSA